MAISTQLRLLAEAAGIQVEWTDAAGHMRELDSATVTRVLDCLDLPDPGDRPGPGLPSYKAAVPDMLTAEVDQWVALPPALRHVKHVILRDESDITHALRVDDCGRFPAPTMGYHAVEADSHRFTLAVAPPRCFGVADASSKSDPHLWGLTAQIYGLRDPAGGGLGTSRAAGRLAARAGAAGGDALCLSPLHAMSPAGHHYSPYTPSHRGFLNWLHTDPSGPLGEDGLRAALAASGLAGDWQRAEASPWIDWPASHAMRRRVWRELYGFFDSSAHRVLKGELQAFQRRGGASLRAHALFAARQAWAAQRGAAVSWCDWPMEWHERGHSATGFFAVAQADDLRFETFLQWAASRAWAKTSAQARAAMKIGLIVDVAVGFEPGGSEAWRNRDVLLRGLTLGAPPDAFNAHGQNWGLTSYAPQALCEMGYQPFLELLRANMRLGGGVRLDHVLGLSRLWVIPEGEQPDRGAYLSYPLVDLLRLVALESWRHRCIVIGEDLGTVPSLLRETLAAHGVLGTEVLLFNKDEDGHFLPPSRWRNQAAATTTTHDLPPLANWRQGLDLRAATFGGSQGVVPVADRADVRDQKVEQLRAAFKTSGSLGDDAPAEDFNDEALRHVARSAAALVLVPMEDALGLTGQPNVPGTVGNYPNWRQRLPIEEDGQLERSMQLVELARTKTSSDA